MPGDNTDGYFEDSSHSRAQEMSRRKSNLAFAFFVMEKSRAQDMEVFYTYCRVLDDIADDSSSPVAEKIRLLKKWQDEIELIYAHIAQEKNAGAANGKISPLGMEVMEVVRRRNVPKEHMLAIIRGVMRDTSPEPFKTFEDLRQYCYGVASAVGLVSICIFGYANPRTELFAETLGYALQFTNILRDVVDDKLSQNRVYIPQEELDAFGINASDLADPSKNPACRRLFKMQFFRAKHYFNKARRLICPEDAKALAPAFIMWDIYECILGRIAAENFNVSKDIIKIPKWKKFLLAFGAVRRANRLAKAKEKTFGRAAVFGGGVAGLSAALNLVYEGFDVDLFESKSILGGRAASFKWRDCQAELDNGPHALMGCYKNFLSFVNMFEIPGAFWPPAESMTFAFSDGTSITASAGGKGVFEILKYGRIKGFLSAGNLKLLTKVKLGFGGARKGETASEYLDRNSIGAEVRRFFWEPFCLSALNTHPSEASAEVMVDTLRKSLLAGGRAGRLIIPRRPLADSFKNAAVIFLKSVGSCVRMSEKITSLNFNGGKLESFSTSAEETFSPVLAVSALPWGALENLLPEGELKRRLADISGADILNVYMLSDRKLFAQNHICLADSPLHWIFDLSGRLPEGTTGYLYGITISASSLNPLDAEKIAEEELKKFFGEFKAVSSVRILCKDATTRADAKTERARPEMKTEYENFLITGDWVKSGLPCTLESAAKNSISSLREIIK